MQQSIYDMEDEKISGTSVGKQLEIVKEANPDLDNTEIVCLWANQQYGLSEPTVRAIIRADRSLRN